MTAEELWSLSGLSGEYEAWAFGEAPDKLALLVKAGIKTATCSAYDLYEPENESLPAVGEYSIILDSHDEAVCIIRTTKVYVAEFDQVTSEHAWKEGEGDRSLEYWRKVHEDFMRRELATVNYSFSGETKVVCEEFEMVFQVDDEESVMSETIDYYEKNAQDFADSTADIEFSELQDTFLSELKNGASILDFGCGSGRDTLYFLQKEYKVTALDGSAELCRIAEEKTGIHVLQMDFNDFDEHDLYDGIWACSSILHLPKNELKNVLIHMEQALHKGGIIYTSFKYGAFSGMRNGRFFTDFTEDSFREYISDVKELTIEKLWITNDVRPGRQDEKWLNTLLRTTRR